MKIVNRIILLLLIAANVASAERFVMEFVPMDPQGKEERVFGVLMSYEDRNHVKHPNAIITSLKGLKEFLPRARQSHIYCMQDALNLKRSA